VDLLELDGAAASGVRLTTLQIDQPRALIELFVNRDGERIPLTTIDVRDIPRLGERKPRIELTGRLLGSREVELSVFVEQRLFNRQRVDVSPFMKKRPKALVPVLIVGALLLAGLILLFALRPWARDAVAEPAPQDAVEQEDAATGDDRTDGAATQDEEPAADGRADAAEPEDAAEPAETAEPEDTAEPADPPEPEGAAADGRVRGADDAADERRERAADIPEREWLVYFLPDRTFLTEDAVGELNQILTQLRAFPEAIIEIEGHCALAGTEAGREAISRERARNARSYLVQNGIDPERIADLRWFGATRPVTLDAGEQRLNRRVVITMRPPNDEG
jgi:outer membrane protein OmpA-like peptidoglycan-associated protein